MLRLPEFSFVSPASIDEAVAALAQHGAQAMVIAGGTDLVPNLKRRQFTAPVLIGLGGVDELRGVRGNRHEGLVIGAMTTLAEVAAHPEIRAGYAALAEAAERVASPIIRNSATLGGNLMVDTRCYWYNQSYEWRQAIGFCKKCDTNAPCRVAPSSPRCLAVSSSDTAPAVMALGARVRLAGPDGVREIPVAALYQDSGRQYLTKTPDELLTEIVLPPQAGWCSTYLKLRRRAAFDFPILGVAAALQAGADGRVAGARVALGAVASAPLGVDAAQSLVGQDLPLSADAVAAVAEAAYKLARPVDNTDLVIPYRKRMARIYTRRALEAVAGA